MSLLNKKILVTGSSGFIGGHLASALYDKGAEIIPFDLQMGLDLREDKHLDPAVKQADIVFHQAAANLIDSRQDPLTDATCNAIGTLKLLQACKKYNVERVIMASTGSIYGKDSLPGTPYGISKYAAEQYGRYFHRYQDVPVTILRYYSVYGPLMSTEKRGVIGIFLKKALQGAVLPVQGGEQERCFIHVKDVVAANLAVLEHDSTIGMTLDVGNPMASIKVMDLAQLILDKYATEGASIQVQKARSGDDERRVPVIASLLLLGWHPRIDLDEGIESVYRWLNSQSS